MKIWPALFKVFGLFVVSFPSKVSGFDDLASSTTPYVYGPQCDFTNNFRCQDGATCVAPRLCMCDAGEGNDGSFLCTKSPDEQRIELTGSNNTLQPWMRDLEAPFHLACRYRITEFTVHKASNNRKCTFQIFGENGVVNDQVMVVTAEVHLKIEEDGIVMFQKGLKISSKNSQEEPSQYMESTIENFKDEIPETFTDLPDDSDLINSGSGMGEFLDEEDMGPEMMAAGPSDDEDMTPLDDWSSPVPLGSSPADGMIRKGVDTNKVARLTVDDCDCEVRFRPGDKDLLDYGLGPGLAVVLGDQIDSVQFEKARSYIAGSPESDVNSDLRSQLTPSEVFLHVSMSYAAVQGESGAGELCRDTSFVYRSYCKTQQAKISALSKCSLLMTNSVIQACLDNTQQQHGGALQVFRQCMWATCSPSSTVCNILKSELNDDTCLDRQTRDNILQNC